MIILRYILLTIKQILEQLLLNKNVGNCAYNLKFHKHTLLLYVLVITLTVNKNK